MYKLADKHKKLALDALNYIFSNPETGYREVKTSKYLEDAFEKLGYELNRAGDIPGFYTIIDTGKPGPEILVLGEMDSLILPTHPSADKATGAAHVCGHAAQPAALVAIAASLKEPGALDNLCGKIRLCAVPAEELIEIEYREGLIKEGKIKYYGGKPEFLRRGMFDGCDIAIMVHTTTEKEIIISKAMVGCVAKRVIYKGKASHAGGAPEDGINALYAATQGLAAINAIRETFTEPDFVRVHPIVTKGGSVVNAIPDEVILESFVRGKTFSAIEKTNKKVNRALIGAALSLGANIEILDYPGYAPHENDDALMSLSEEAAKEATPSLEVKLNDLETGSSDIGDLSRIMPCVQPEMPGARGSLHGIDFEFENPELAVLGAAKLQLKMIEMLLENGATRAKAIVSGYKPEFASRDEYFAYIDKFITTGDRIKYSSGKAEVIL